VANREDGYVTITVLALLLGLSIVAVSLLNLTASKARQANRLADTILLDIAIENTMNQTLARLANRELDTSTAIEGLDYVVHDQTITVRLVDEGRKLALVLADDEAISARAETIGLTNAEAQSLRLLARNLKNESGETRRLRFQDALDEFTENERACVSANFTPFRPALQLDRRDRGAQSLDGVMVQVFIEGRIGLGQQLGLSRTVLFTGRRDTPIWLFDEQRYDPAKQGACSRDQTP
jgi:hypothetical protein